MGPHRELQPQDFGIGRLFWRIHEAVIVGDVDTGRIVLWNPAAEALFGYADVEVIGCPIEILIPEHLRARHRAGLARFGVTGQSVLMDADLGLELPAVHRSGRLLTIELLLSPIDEAPAGGRYVLAVIRDATARKRAEDQRVELAREQAARAVAEAAQQRFALLAEAGRLLASSLDWETTLANVARLVVPRFADWCVVDIVQPDGSLRPVEVAVAEAGAEPLLRDLVARNRRSPGWEHHPTAVALRTAQPQLLPEVPDATLATIARDEEHLALILRHRPRSVIAVPLTSRGRTLGVITFLATAGRAPYGPDDVPLAVELGGRAATALEHASLFRQAKDAIAIRDEFISVASHELRTPLTSLRGHVQLLLRQLQRDGTLDIRRLMRGLGTIDAQSARLSRLVSQLLDLSRLEAGKLRLERRDTDLTGLVTALVADARVRTDRHDITVRAAEPVRASVDALRLEQVLTNLLDNAIRYSPEGGAIDIELSRPSAGRVQFAVRDHGLGIPPEKRGQIFDLFYQAHTGGAGSGLGLGLYVSREIVELHGGEIHVEFPPDGGTRFVVRLPVEGAEPGPLDARDRS